MASSDEDDESRSAESGAVREESETSGENRKRLSRKAKMATNCEEQAETADCKSDDRQVSNNKAKRKSYKPRKVVISDEAAGDGATSGAEKALRKSTRLGSKARTVPVEAEPPKRKRKRKLVARSQPERTKTSDDNRKQSVKEMTDNVEESQLEDVAMHGDAIRTGNDGDDLKSDAKDEVPEEEEQEDGESESEKTTSHGNGGSQKTIIHKKRPCDVCGRAYNTFYLKVHMRKHTGEKPFRCQVCVSSFSTESLLRTHFQRYHGNTDELQCDICNKIFASKGSLKIHKQIHSDFKPYKCVLCNKEFKQPGVLNEHLKTHNNNFPFQCEVCGRSFKSKRSVFRHKESAHEGIKRTFLCTVCGKIFHDKSSLWRHQKRHEKGYTKHICEVCGKQFHERKVLSTHMLIHEDIKPYQCQECQKFFRHYSVLKRHLSVHTGVKPFKCEKCGRQFIHRVYLLRHKCTAQVKNRPDDKGNLENSVPPVVPATIAPPQQRIIADIIPQQQLETFVEITQPEMGLCDDKTSVLLELKDMTSGEIDVLPPPHGPDVIVGQLCHDGFGTSCLKPLTCQVYTETISNSIL